MLASNSIFDVLDASLVTRRPMSLGRSFAVEGPEGPLGIEVEAFPVPGKIPLYLEDAARLARDSARKEGDTLGLKVSEAAVGPPFLLCAELRQA